MRCAALITAVVAAFLLGSPALAQITGTIGGWCPLGGCTFTGPVTVSGSSFGLSGNISAPAWTTNGIRYKNVPATLTDTTSSGTVANAYTDLWGSNTIAASSATTFTNYYGSYFKAPVAGTNVTFTNKAALGADSVSIGGATIGSNALAVTGASSFSGATNFNGFNVSSINNLTGVNLFGFSGPVYATPAGANVWHFGQVDAASPVAQTLGVQGVVAGTSNTAGALWKIQDSAGTGSAASGGMEFDVHPAGSAGNSQNAASAWLTASGAGLAALPLIGSDATHTDATVCEDTTTHALYAGSGAAGICLGTSSVRFKHAIEPLRAGLQQIMGLQPVSYRLNAGHGDPNKTLYGFTAEQGETVLPQLVGLDANGKPNTFDYVGVVPVLVKAVQEQQAEIAALKSCRLRVMGACWF